ncbi:MAG: hypothetical protein CL843_05655 [Crocinitomicaceae bacterium]|nr:hypothetical protein [Crocinitomicaceae bacterium]|tara:strand:+ start:1727 stop:3160 length:1434 start_codon:yes stop_codon:yes gene_type:complete
MRFILLLFTIFCTITASAQVIIKGNIDNYYHEKIEVLIAHDFISNSKVSLASTQIDDSGNFELSFNGIHYSFTGYLRVADREIPLHIEQNSNYEIKLHTPENLEDILTPVEISSIEIQTHNTFEEWQAKSDFLVFCDVFLDSNQTYLFYRQDSALNSLKQLVRDSFDVFGKHSTYLKKLIQYNLADIELLYRPSTAIYFDSLLAEEPIDYHHPSYTRFLTHLLGERVQTVITRTKEITKNKLVGDVKTAFDKLLASDSILAKRDDIREYLMLQYAYSNYNSAQIPQSVWDLYFYQVKTSSEFEFHREIASLVLEKIHRLEQGMKAPNFTFLTLEGDEKVLTDYEGKFVYIQFWAPWSQESIKDMKLIQRLNEENEKNIHFISVAINRSKEEAFKTIAPYNFKWDMLHFNLDYSVLRKYGIDTAPMYFLIDPYGKLLIAPSDPPIKMFELLNQLKTNPKKGDTPAYMLINDYSKERLR